MMDFRELLEHIEGKKFLRHIYIEIEGDSADRYNYEEIKNDYPEYLNKRVKSWSFDAEYNTLEVELY